MKNCIYKYEFPNGKCYIGQSVDFKRRHDVHLRSAQHVDYALRKYKNDVKTTIILSDLTFDEMNWWECFFICAYGCLHPNGYNHTIGGRDNKGEGNPMYGKHHSLESRERMSKQTVGMYVGRKNPFYGKRHTVETRKLLSEMKAGRLMGDENPSKRSDVRMKISEKKRGENHHMFGKHHSMESRRKISENSPVKIKVMNLTTGMKFESLTEAASFYGRKSINSISAACAGRQKTAYGCEWRYL